MDLTAQSDAAFARMTRDRAYRLNVQVEQRKADDFAIFAVASAIFGACVVLGYFIGYPIVKRLFG